MFVKSSVSFVSFLVFLQTSSITSFASNHEFGRNVAAFGIERGGEGKRTKSSLFMGVGTTLGRVKDSILSRERTREDLKIGIAGFYDRSSALWEEVWGEHMHHGYYIPENRTDHKQAQIDLIDEVLKWAGVDDANPPKSIVDVGCGIGGSSRHIAKKYGCTAKGITLSPYQAKRGNDLVSWYFPIFLLVVFIFARVLFLIKLNLISFNTTYYENSCRQKNKIWNI